MIVDVSLPSRAWRRISLSFVGYFICRGWPTCKKWVFGTHLGRVGWEAVSKKGLGQRKWGRWKYETLSGSFRDGRGQGGGDLVENQ